MRLIYTMTLLHLVTSAVTLQCILAQSVFPEERPGSWLMGENDQVKPDSQPEDPSQCSCTCQVKDKQPKGHARTLPTDNPRTGGHPWEGGLDGRIRVAPDGWSSTGHLPGEDQVEVIRKGQENHGEGRGEGGEHGGPMDNEVSGPVLVDLDTPDRYKGFSWGHGNRYPWKDLRDTMCIRQPCGRDSDCCLRWNICDRSAKVCINCWYGHPCLSERDCCFDFPYCHRKWKKDPNGLPTTVESGRCVDRR